MNKKIVAMAFMLLLLLGACVQAPKDGSSQSDTIGLNQASQPAGGGGSGGNPSVDDPTGGADASGINFNGTGRLPQPKNTFKVGNWTIQDFDLDRNPRVKKWIEKTCNIAPGEWPVFPNVQNPDAKSCPFDVANGAEYGMDMAPFCHNVDHRCDMVVPAWHFELITGTYGFLDLKCQGGKTGADGCLLLKLNVGEETCTWRNQSADNTFHLMGRYWDGDDNDQQTWGTTSHAIRNMLNSAQTKRNATNNDILNAGPDGANAGANCSTPKGCQSVDVKVFVHGVCQPIALMTATVTR